MRDMRVAVLFSGGKDSTFAIHKSLQAGHEIKYLVTVFPKGKESFMFHWPALEITKLQAESMGLKQIVQRTEGKKEEELMDLEKALSKIKDEIDAVVTGAVASNYQKTRVDKICQKLNLKHISPLWGMNPENLLREMISSGFNIILTGVASEGLGQDWIGKSIDENAVNQLKKLNERFGVNISFEGGEAESLVLDGPIFKKRIEITDSEKVWDSKTSSGYLEIKKVVLSSK
jgi:ABC transporter with metal-binding/Fe-S-binding domain ATP-binding protein